MRVEASGLHGATALPAVLPKRGDSSQVGTTVPAGSVRAGRGPGCTRTVDGAWRASVPLIIGLAIESDGARARGGAIVYAVGLCAMLAVSTTYHRWVHTLRARAMWRRADHATIFALIGGTCTALALSSLTTRAAVALLVTIRITPAGGPARLFRPRRLAVHLDTGEAAERCWRCETNLASTSAND